MLYVATVERQAQSNIILVFAAKFKHGFPILVCAKEC